MSEQPRLSARPSRQELRKAIVRLRLEVQRQELRQEMHQLMQPLQHVREMGEGLRRQLPASAPLWAAGGAGLLALLLGRNRRLRRMLRLGLLLIPLLLEARSRNRSESGDEKAP